MLSKDLHPVRRSFRMALLLLLGLSIGFMAYVVSLRIEYRDKGVRGPLQIAMFQADILQHRALAFVSDDAEDMVIAERMLRYSFFSPLYAVEGVRMLQMKADDGYEPAQTRLDTLFPEKTDDQGI